jgi:mRNA-degrading endonuclease toxin of MazEF toxin-antitoxin module
MRNIKAGEVWLCDLGEKDSVVGSEFYKERLVLIVSNIKCNTYSSNCQIIPLSSKVKKGENLPTHCVLNKVSYNWLKYDSICCGENITTISKKRLKYKIGEITTIQLQNAIEAMKKTFY